MAQETKLVRDEAYEEMGSSYECVQVAALDSALQEHGVSDAGILSEDLRILLVHHGDLP